MADSKYLSIASGVVTEKTTISAASATQTDDAGKIPCLDANGKLAMAFMPSGLAGADTVIASASEALLAGDLVNIYDVSGTAKVRKASALNKYEAHGFVLANVASGATATVYAEGSNNQVSSLTAGRQYLSVTAGKCTDLPPSGSGNMVQIVGFASSAANLNFQLGTPIILA